MRPYDIIEKKRNGGELAAEEIRFFANGYLNGEIADYQMSAFLMAVYFRGMNFDECSVLTECMINSGDVVNLSKIPGIKVDKHSTGGVGDKTTLIVVPIVAACGVKIAKMSGRGLGLTGGTADKLEAIPGVNVFLSENKFFDVVKNVGCCVISQTDNLTPLDKKIYALRDATATAESIPLIASSIMSKKIASGADCILLDVKVGSGAFLKTEEQAVELAEIMVKIGKNFDKKVIAVITDMENPLGCAVGNALEVVESCAVLKGWGPKDLTDVSIYLAANMVHLAGKGTLEECEKMVKSSIETGEAFEKFKEMISVQGGDTSAFECESDKVFGGFKKASVCREVTSDCEGYISAIDACEVGRTSMVLGAGRETKDSTIDYSAGVVLKKNPGDFVSKGEIVAILYSSSAEKCAQAELIFKSALKFSDIKPKPNRLIRAKVDAAGVEYF